MCRSTRTQTWASRRGCGSIRKASQSARSSVHHLQHLSITCNTCPSLATPVHHLQHVAAPKTVSQRPVDAGRYDKIWVSGSVTQTVAELCKAVEEAVGGNLKCTAVTGPEQKIQCEKTDVCTMPCNMQRAAYNAQRRGCCMQCSTRGVPLKCREHSSGVRRALAMSPRSRLFPAPS